MLLPLLLLPTLPAAAQVPVDLPGGELPAERQGGPFGLGVALGAPGGLTGKLWLGSWSAVQFTAGADLGVLDMLAATADYVVVFRPFQPSDPGYSVPLYLGGGLDVDLDLQGSGYLYMGPRVVAGASVMATDLPVEFYVEVAPTFYFAQVPGWSIDGQIGVRAYF